MTDAAPMGQAALFAGVELGGTKCICILGRGPDDVIATRRIATTSPDETLATIEAVLDGWTGVAALGIASFGPLDLARSSPTWGTITQTPKLAWRHTCVGARLAARYRVPLAMDTDVAGAAMAEGRWGACVGLNDHVYVTVGTGVGVGIVSGGAPLTGRTHPEAGHMLVRRAADDRWPGACPYHGDCVEGLASGPAIATRAGCDVGDLPPGSAIWDSVAEALGCLVHNLVLTVAPERIVVGGGVVERQPHLLPRIRSRALEALNGYAGAADLAGRMDDYIVPPRLGDRAGPLGALALAMTATNGPAPGSHATIDRRPAAPTT